MSEVYISCPVTFATPSFLIVFLPKTLNFLPVSHHQLWDNHDVDSRILKVLYFRINMSLKGDPVGSKI